MELNRIRRSPQRKRKKQLHKRMSWQTVFQVMEQFADGKIPEAKACEWLDIGRNRLYTLKRRWLAVKADEVKTNWLYKRADTLASRLPPEVRSFLEEELRYIKQESPFFRGHFNFAALAEECWKRFGHRFHRNTIRRWATAQGFFNPDTDKTGKAYIRFEMSGVGMLFQHDSSIHVWVPHTKRQDVLILTIDDHSRKVVGAKLVPQDTSWHHLSVVRETVEMYGCPLAYYTDNHFIFSPGTDTHAQFARALSSLDIALRLTGKRQPQAKGKVEKRFDFFQRRIPYLCERYNITNLTQANKILQDSVAFFNQCHIHDETQQTPDQRWQRALAENHGYMRPLQLSEEKLNIIFGLHYPRVVRKDGAVEFASKKWPIPYPPVGKAVSVVLLPPRSSRLPHTQLFIVYQDRIIAHFILRHGYNPHGLTPQPPQPNGSQQGTPQPPPKP